jgi:hypothetical protein
MTDFDVSRESGADLHRGLIHAAPITLLLWGVIVGALLWVL